MLRKVALKNYGKELKDLLNKWYWEDGMLQKDIAKELGVSTGAISLWFEKLDIQQRPMSHWHTGREVSEGHKEIIKKTHIGKVVSKETREKISKGRKGISPIGKHERFQGRRNRADGYLQIYKADHPFSNAEGYVMEHRLVMERHIGRFLTPKEVVHHINRKRNDNRPENLYLFASGSDHTKYHSLERFGKGVELSYEY